MSEVPLPHTYEEAEQFLPEEEKFRINKEIEDLEAVLKAGKKGTILSTRRRIAKLTARRNALGGDTDAILRQVLHEYRPDNDSGWFQEAFGGHERDFFLKVVFPKLRETLGEKGKNLPMREVMKQVRVLDLGMGMGRSLRMLINLVEDPDDNTVAEEFARNVYGIDLMEENLEAARASFGRGRLPKPPDEHFMQGSYLESYAERLPEGGVDLIICMLHSSFHCVTQKQWERFLTNAREALKPGGLLLFDTIGMQGSSLEMVLNGQPQENLSRCMDLEDLYTQLWLRYCRTYQPFIPEDSGIDLRRMPRAPIFDNTTGKGFYFREVPKTEHIQYVIGQIKGGLELVMARTVSTDANFPPGKAISLGRSWIQANGFEGDYRTEIQRRITTGMVHPEQLLGYVPEEGEAIDRILDIIAERMVREYRNMYCLYRKE